jgi:hypothetical protein
VRLLNTAVPRSADALRLEENQPEYGDEFQNHSRRLRTRYEGLEGDTGAGRVALHAFLAVPTESKVIVGPAIVYAWSAIAWLPFTIRCAATSPVRKPSFSVKSLVTLVV